MSVSTSSKRQPPGTEGVAGALPCTVIRRPLQVVAALPASGDAEEAAFWARLEEREEGRAALETDHLFDTSYSWAV